MVATISNVAGAKGVAGAGDFSAQPDPSKFASPRQCDNFINGAFQRPVNGQYQDVVSPYTGKCIGRVGLSGAEDADSAVQAAARAFATWSRTPIKERCQHLFRFRQLMLERIDVLANAAALESGKTTAEARAGIMKGLEVTEFALSLQNIDAGGVLEVSRGVSCEMRREPLGVVCGITPFNFPAMVPMWMYPIAIALGNCFILKPSEKVPITSSLIAEIFSDAGFPKGVFTILNGGREAVEALIDHPDIHAVGFVGSTPVARAVYTRATALGKRALCLGGAKNQLIIAPDADVDMTVRSVVDSFTGCAGQRCMAASLVIGVGDVEKIISKVIDTAKALKIGGNMGAIIDKTALKRLENGVADAVAAGAKLVLDGRKPLPPNGFESGNWFAPTIIDHASAQMSCAKEELFGPIMTVVRVKNISEALEIDHQSQFGNATSVFTTSGAVARYVAERSSSGMVGINIGVPVPREPFSFGGTKTSKYGHGDITGESVLDFWSHRKKITSKWQVEADANWMS